MPETYIDQGLKVLTKLRAVLTPHGIQIMNVLNIGSTSPASLRRFGYDGEESPQTVTVELAIPQDDHEDPPLN